MILFYQWNAFMQRGMENALKRLNIEYEVYYDCARDWDSDNEFADKFRKRITAEGTVISTPPPSTAFNSL